MTKRKSTIIIFAIIAIACLIFSARFAYAKAETESVDFLVHGNSYSADGAFDGETYSLFGSQGRGRVGMIINQPLNVNQTISFDMELRLNSEFTENETAYHQRAYILTLNEYSMNGELPSVDSNIFSSSSGPNGVQLQFIPYKTGVSARICALGTANSVVLNSVDDYFESALFGGVEHGGKLALEKIRVDMYISGANYAIKLQCYDALSGELSGSPAVLTVGLDKISENGGFGENPYLGFYLVNEAAKLAEDVTEVEVDFKVSNLINGRVKGFSFEQKEISSLKAGESVTLKPTVTPWIYGDSLGDITFSYSSDNDIVKVTDGGVVSTTADGGFATITAMTSEGNTLKIPVLVYDETDPVITINGEVPIYGRQYEKISLPSFTVTDNSGYATSVLAVISPETRYICEEDEFSFIPSTFGTYTIKYSAKDHYGNEVERRFQIEVEEAPSSGQWSVYRENFAYTVLDEKLGGDELTATLTVGSLEAGESSALVYSNRPITFTKKSDGSYNSFYFDMSVEIEDISYNAASELDLSRLFTVYLMESYEDGTITPEQFNRDKSGMEMAFGKNPYWTDDLQMRYRLRSLGSASMSEQHIATIDTLSEDADARFDADTARNNQYGHGETYLPWFEYGQALRFSDKYAHGETFRVKVEYFEDVTINSKGKEVYDRYYKWSFDEFTFKIPANYVSGEQTGYSRQAFFGFKLWSRNGVIRYTVNVSGITNGDVKNVSFKEGVSSIREYDDTFILNPFVTDNSGNKLNSSYSFSSGDDSIAAVDSSGRVRIVGYGEVAIYATSALENKSATHTIYVDVPMFMLLKSEYTIPLGKDGTLPIVTGAKSSVPINVTSSDPFGLVALKDGTLQAVKIGEYTVRAEYLGKTAECIVKVVKSSEKPPVVPTEEEESAITPSDSGCGGSIDGQIGLIMAAFMLTVTTIAIKRRKND